LPVALYERPRRLGVTVDDRVLLLVSH
jgi:hypothetical protein